MNFSITHLERLQEAERRIRLLERAVDVQIKLNVLFKEFIQTLLAKSS